MLELKNICFGVETEESTKEIIKDVSFVVPDDKFVVITGPNGGGKSTLARLIMGIEKPSSGRIFYNGEDITDMDITQRANIGISFALQQPVRFKGIHVVDLLRLAAKRNLTVGEACEYLSAVGLCARDYIDREVNASLSGGELKRIEIATVLARGTQLSVFDEPEAGIDLWSFQSLIQVFENMQKRNHGSILIISHQERILNIADEIILIADGKLRDQGSKDRILPELLKSTLPVTCNRILEGGVADA
ncbi:MAG: ATP-binding cassette domain-containing protein [Oscillospiraceae bacterium]|nr:ATP-binding cassette domain-containing protein [Oscillospiraceae bacterium]